MREALALARRGLGEGHMPIGAVVVAGGEVVRGARWSGDYERGLLGHPELLALTAADAALGARRREAILYTTLEPCLMCMGAAMSFFARGVVWALDSRADGAARVAELWAPPDGHPRPGETAAYALPELVPGVLAGEAADLLRAYLARGAEGPQARFAERVLRR